MGKKTKDNKYDELFHKAGFAESFAKGDAATKLSAIIMGLGCAVRGQLARGFIFLAFQVLF